MSRLLALVLLLAPLSACDKNASDSQAPVEEDAVDRLTRELLDALADGDRDRAQSLANQSLAIELDQRTVATVGRTLAWLGPITSLARRDQTPVSGGVERHYRVGFDHGELTLTVVVVGDKVEGFEFDKGQWDALSERATAAAAGTLAVARFELVAPGGKPLTGPLDPAAIHYSLALEGLDAQLREHHVTLGKLVFDQAGEVVYRQRQDDDIRFPQAETGSSDGIITGNVAVPGPGSYELELTINDLIGGKSLVHRVPFTIE
ncbi:MAG TPA: hypothetical protein VK034_11070 [Enhygromyxa sp.]|nr:hypothetical protein [Enhygromyxa sp.]